jgi:predicted N-acetyltransferase YhbS
MVCCDINRNGRLKMGSYSIRQISTEEYSTVRQLDMDAFGHNERDSDGAFHKIYADNIRRSPYFIPKFDLVAVTNKGFILGHGIFSALPMGDDGNHVIWLNSLAVRHGAKDDHSNRSYEFQRKGIGTVIVRYGLEIARSLGYSACMICGNQAVYQNKMGFSNYREFGIEKDESVDTSHESIFAIALAPAGFNNTNKILSYSYYDFSKITKS